MQLHNKLDVLNALAEHGIELTDDEHCYLASVFSDDFLNQANPSRYAAQILFSRRFDERQKGLVIDYCEVKPAASAGVLAIEDNRYAICMLAVFLGQARDDAETLYRFFGESSRQVIAAKIQHYLASVLPEWLELLDISLNSDDESQDVECFLSRFTDIWSLV